MRRLSGFFFLSLSLSLFSFRFVSFRFVSFRFVSPRSKLLLIRAGFVAVACTILIFQVVRSLVRRNRGKKDTRMVVVASHIAGRLAIPLHPCAEGLRVNSRHYRRRKAILAAASSTSPSASSSSTASGASIGRTRDGRPIVGAELPLSEFIRCVFGCVKRPCINDLKEQIS